MGIETKDKNSPFKNHLTDDKFGTLHAYEYIKALQSTPSKIVRLEESYRRGETMGTYEDRLDRFIIAKELLQELRESSDILLPNFDYIVGYGSDSKTPEIYTVVDKIEGTNLEELRKQRIKVPGDQIDKLCTGLLNYFEDKYQNGGDFLYDIVATRQYVYGHKHQEKKDSIYLVDVGPFFSEILPKELTSTFFTAMSDFRIFIRDCGNLSEHQLIKAEKRFEKFFKSISDD